VDLYINGHGHCMQHIKCPDRYFLSALFDVDTLGLPQGNAFIICSQ
jgi:hypothetical protein